MNLALILAVAAAILCAGAAIASGKSRKSSLAGAVPDAPAIPFGRMTAKEKTDLPRKNASAADPFFEKKIICVPG